MVNQKEIDEVVTAVQKNIASVEKICDVMEGGPVQQGETSEGEQWLEEETSTQKMLKGVEITDEVEVRLSKIDK